MNNLLPPLSLDDYILRHIEPEPDYLYRLWRATNIHMLHGRMASGHLQGRLLKMLVQMIRPHYILEVGTFSGYSALCMAEGLTDDGHLYTFEINDEQEDFTRPWIENSPVADKITFIIGDANTEAPKLGIEFDMAFHRRRQAYLSANLRNRTRHSAPRWFHPCRQHPLGRPRHRPPIPERPADPRHCRLQRLHTARPPRRASHPAPTRRSYTD